MPESVPAALITHHQQLRRRRAQVERQSIATLWPDATVEQARWGELALDGAWSLARFEEPTALEQLERALNECAESAVTMRTVLLDALTETCFLLNDYPRALSLAREASTTWASLDEPINAALSKTWGGAALVQLARYREGLETLHAALEELESRSAGTRAARAHNYLAVVFEELGDYSRAFDAYECALDCARADDDSDMVGRVLANWGDAHIAHGTPDVGLPMLERAVEVLRSIGAHWHYGWCLLSIGRIHHQKNDLTLAQRYHQQALEAVERGHAPRSRIEVYASLGGLASEQGRHDEAFNWLERALKEAKRLGIQRELYKTHKLLCDAYKRIGRYREALEHHEAFFDIRSATFDEVAREKIAAVKAELELQRVQEAREAERTQSIELAAAYARLAEQAEQLARLSVRDPLTGLFNRRHFDDALNLELQRARVFSGPLSLALVDADHFKRINDTMGHLHGDLVLKRLAETMAHELRQSDLATRFGGEEFALILPHTSLEGARVAAEKIRLAIESLEWPGQPGFRVTVSIGLAQAQPAESLSQFVQRADEALYRAKGQGRNQVVLAPIAATNEAPTAS